MNPCDWAVDKALKSDALQMRTEEHGKELEGRSSHGAHLNALVTLDIQEDWGSLCPK